MVLEYVFKRVKGKTSNFSLLMPLCYTEYHSNHIIYGIVMLSSRRALQISGTLVAVLEKFTFLKCLQVPFNTPLFSCKLMTNLI